MFHFEPHVDLADRAAPVPFAPSEPAPGYVEVPLTYLVDTGEKPVTYIPAPGGGEIRRTGQYAQSVVAIHDGRDKARDLSLDRQGFVLTRHDTAVADFHDPEEVRAVYYPEMERLVKAATGASRVLVFDHNVRIDGGPGGNRAGVSEPVRTVHNDYTAKSGPQRVRTLLDADEAEALLKNRVAVINVWKPIQGPVQTAPLALADAQSITPGDLTALELVYPDRTGEIYNATFNPDHRWYYFPDMQKDEAILIKGYDSVDDGRARFTLHTAFDDPTSPPAAAPRQSIEVRAFAFFNS
jgi:hypothetical protein